MGLYEELLTMGLVAFGLTMVACFQWPIYLLTVEIGKELP